ncbi:hypothetical protein T4B_13163 [Trichinella pseudospiralis]|uniref:Uncharacterized protein n=1 Tax=Trichinella pseudospiralis TaxID=6337 RepID=A0A0V1GIU0_TRIPS|nr:hypothetical protein T4B_13163 [Trichinella pseudospiralis]
MPSLKKIYSTKKVDFSKVDKMGIIRWEIMRENR